MNLDLTAIGAGLAVTGTLGAGIAIGLIGAKVVEGITRQPELSGKIFVNGLIFAALAEVLGLAAVVIGFLFSPLFQH